MNVAISTSDLHAEGSLMENTSAEMSPVARWANAGNFGGRKPEEQPVIGPGAPQHAQQVDWNEANATSIIGFTVGASSDVSAPIDHERRFRLRRLPDDNNIHSPRATNGRTD